jgi:hypothetical protein
MAIFKKPPRDDSHAEDERSALETFEQILEIMPDDRGALEAAILAAHACGDESAALKHRLRLADVLLESGDRDSLQEQAEILRTLDDPRAKSWIDAFDLKMRLGSALIDAPPRESSADWAADKRAAVRTAFNISEEIDLAWKLFEHREISQEEYSALVRDITEMSASHNGGTVSVLHALEAGNHKNQERILSFLAQEAEETGTPFVSLSCFAMRSELAHLLPHEFMLNRGAVVFETLGRDRLVAVLNPFSQSLRIDVQALLAPHPCHFYLAKASEFDLSVVRLKETAAAESA